MSRCHWCDLPLDSHPWPEDEDDAGCDIARQETHPTNRYPTIPEGVLT